MKKTVLSFGVALMLSMGAAHAGNAPTVTEVKGSIPQCLELFRSRDQEKVILDCGAYLLRIDLSSDYLNKRYITCEKNGNGSIGTCKDVWEN